MSKAIDDLRNEHEAILGGLKILDSVADRVKTGTPVDMPDVASFLGFLVEFADKCHHGKEEGILFPAMTAAGVPEQGGPIGVMLAEHAQGRELIARMKAAMADGPGPGNFAQPAEEYAALLRAHIQKENGVLFPMAEKVLDAPKLKRIYEGFEEHESKVIGHGRHERLHAMLEELSRKYLAG